MATIQLFVCKVCEHALFHGLGHFLILGVGLAMGALSNHWWQARYCKKVKIRACWFAKNLINGKRRLIDKVVSSKTALDMTAGKDLAAKLVKAARRTKADVMLCKKSWTPDIAKLVLTQIGYEVSMICAQGTMSAAMNDIDVTTAEFVIGAFRRGNEISIIVARKEELQMFRTLSVVEMIGDADEIREMRQLAHTCTDSENQYCITTEEYM